MVFLRSGFRTTHALPDFSEDEVPHPYGFIEVQRNRRELNGLGVLLDGELNHEARDLTAPQLPVDPGIDYFAIQPQLRPDRCQEVLWPEGGHPKQCGNRPGRDGQLCWRHAPNTRTNATAARQNRIRARLQHRRDEVQERRQRERLMQETARRFGDLPDREEEDLGDDLELRAVASVDILNGLEDMQEAAQETLSLPNDERRHTLNNNIPALLDELLDERSSQHGVPQDARLRCYDVGGIQRIGGDCQAMYFKCSLCKMFQYPFDTCILPELRTIWCRGCGCWVHRHCQATVPTFHHDGHYMCPACVEGL